MLTSARRQLLERLPGLYVVPLPLNALRDVGGTNSCSAASAFGGCQKLGNLHKCKFAIKRPARDVGDTGHLAARMKAEVLLRHDGRRRPY
jgi:hypothetical protein